MSSSERTFEVGEPVPEEGGIFLCRHQMLSKTFNVFAACEDLPRVMQYREVLRYVSTLKGWHGFDGTNYATSRHIEAAIEDGSYKGGWIIPSYEVLAGINPERDIGINARNGKMVQPDNLFDRQTKGAFKDTFKLTRIQGVPGFPQLYWSSMEYPRTPSSSIWVADFSSGYVDWYSNDTNDLNCRLVRLVELKGFPELDSAPIILDRPLQPVKPLRFKNKA